MDDIIIKTPICSLDVETRHKFFMKFSMILKVSYGHFIIERLATF